MASHDKLNVPHRMTDVAPDTPAFRGEFFSPVATVFRIEDEAGAIALANDSDFGLGGPFWTKDVARGQRVASRVDTGMMFIKNIDWSGAELPFGGTTSNRCDSELRCRSSVPKEENSMNVLIIGAAGKTGAIVVERAVAAGHVVTAFVRDAATYRAPANVHVVAGDATDQATMDKAMAGQDAVIDTIGGKTPYRKTALERSVAGAVVAAMKANGARRVIVISSFGVGDSADQVGWFVEHVIVPTWLRGSTEDKAATEGVVRASGIAFVIVRPAMLTDDDNAGNVKVFQGHDIAHKITRAGVAQFCVDQLTSDEHVGCAVTIANS